MVMVVGREGIMPKVEAEMNDDIAEVLTLS